MKFGWVGALVDSVCQIHESIHKICLPTLLIHGKEDIMVPMSSSEFAYNNISSDDKTLEVRKSDQPSTAGCLHYSLKVVILE